MIICKECNREFKSLDSLRRHNNQKHKINAEQTYIEYVLDGIKPRCKCGCGKTTNFFSIEKGYVDYVLGHAARVNNNWGHNPNAIKKSHETQKKMHDSGELNVWNKGLTIYDERVRNNIDKVMANPNRSKNISKKLKGVAKSEEHKENIKIAADKRWESDEEREKQSNRRMEYIIKNGFQTKSKLENIFKDILINNFGFIEGVHFYHQFYVREIKSLYDFKISGKKLMIEVDGDFWHCNPNSKFATPQYASQKKNLIQDEIKNKWCLDNNFILLRFWETDINNNPDTVIEILKKFI